jgi:hypothetical protein
MPGVTSACDIIMEKREKERRRVWIREKEFVYEPAY